MKIHRFSRLGKSTTVREDIVHLSVCEGYDVTVLFDVFQDLPNLTKVTILAKQLVDISVLSKYSIKTLEINCNTVDLEPLCDMPSLENLKVNTIAVDTLKKLENLKRLSICESCPVELLYVLPSGLTSLSLPNKGVKGEIDTERVVYSETLKSLRIGKGGWKGLIERFPCIHKLYTNGSFIGEQVLSRLTHLSVAHGVLTEFSFLSNYPALKTLCLNKVHLPGDITPLWSFPLRAVNLYSCNVKSIAGIDEEVLDKLKVVRSHRPHSARPDNFCVVECLFKRPLIVCEDS